LTGVTVTGCGTEAKAPGARDAGVLNLSLGDRASPTICVAPSLFSYSARDTVLTHFL